MAPPAAPQEAVSSPWYGADEQGEVQVDLYFFWTLTCPHCRRAAAFLTELEAELPWLRVHGHEITQDPANAELFAAVAKATGNEARAVPAIFICERMIAGFHEAETTGAVIRDHALACRAYATEALAGAQAAVQPVQAEGTAQIPILGTVALDAYSLPVLTVVLAGLDAFNPCAFFVLMFLLSLLVHAHSRARMVFIGGVFVLFSGGIYFLFMAAWLNLFMIVGHLAMVTVIAGIVALLVGILNVKDYFWFGAGLSLSIPEGAKPRLFERMRGVVSASNLPLMVAGTVALALAANSYELLCTAGFPMVFTRALTLQELSPGAHYLYLALYNVIYVIPLMVLVALFTLAFAGRKLTERQGRILKLVSGVMMLGLGILLLAAPGLMTNVLVAAALVALALVTGAAAALFGPRDPRPDT
jgi:glutaredoxin